MKIKLLPLMVAAFIPKAALASVFESTEQDVGNGWLNYLFTPSAVYPTVSSTFDGVTATLPNPFSGDGALPSAFHAALGMYSDAILIIAAIILFYHLTAMVAETAHHGVAMGKRASQIWAPIRLVVAIGLLVPINGGLNAGQYIVVKIASMGSGLASNVWDKFLDNLAQYKTQAIPPNAPMVQDTALNIIKSEACAYAWNYHISDIKAAGLDMSNQLITPTTAAFTLGALSGTKTAYSADSVGDVNVCGWFFVPANSAVANSTLQSSLAIAAAKAQNDAISSNMASFRSVGQTIIGVMPSSTQSGATTGAKAAAADFFKPMLQDAVAKYQADVRDNLAKITDVSQVDMSDVAAAIRPYGWVMAGTFLNTIDRAQAAIGAAAADSVPQSAPPLLHVEDFTKNPYSGIWGMLNDSDELKTGWDLRHVTAQDLAAFDYYQKKIIMAPSSPTTNVGCAAMLGLNNTDNSAATAIGNNWMGRGISKAGAWTGERIFHEVDLLATQNGIWKAGSGVGCGGESPSNFKLGIEISNVDPLAQLAFLGHSNLDVGFGLLTAGIVAGALSSTAGGVLSFLSLLFFVTGFMLAFLVPLMPFLRFFFGVITWFAALIEAIVAMPLVALAHLNPEGEGLVGGAKSGYIFVFNLLLRPVLMVFGLIAGLILFLIALSFLNYAYSAAVSGGGGTAYGHAAMARMIYSVIYAAVVCVCANHSFALIDHLPEQAMKWFGASGQSMPRVGEASHVEGYAQAVSAVAGKQMIGETIAAGSGIGTMAKTGIKTFTTRIEAEANKIGKGMIKTNLPSKKEPNEPNWAEKANGTGVTGDFNKSGPDTTGNKKRPKT